MAVDFASSNRKSLISPMAFNERPMLRSNVDFYWRISPQYLFVVLLELRSSAALASTYPVLVNEISLSIHTQTESHRPLENAAHSLRKLFCWVYVLQSSTLKIQWLLSLQNLVILTLNAILEPLRSALLKKPNCAFCPLTEIKNDFHF